MKKEQYEIHARLGLKHWWNYGTKMFFLRLIRRNLHNRTHILDAGCGTGDMIMLLKDNYRVTGIDCSPDAIKFCLEKGFAKNVIMCDINNLPFKNEVFNGVVSLDVLYHKWIFDDSYVLKRIYSILRPGGKVFIQLPSYNWLRSSHDELAFASRRYTVGRLTNLLKTAMFVKIKVRYRMSLLFPLAVVGRLILKSKSSDMKQINPFLNYILRMIINFENFLTQYISFPFGLSVIGIAEK